MANIVHKGGPSVVGTGASCKICGHPAHCGGPTYTTVRDYAVDGGGTRDIKVCNQCRCGNCAETIEKNKNVKPNQKRF